MPRSRLIVFAVLLMALSACGGGQTLTPPVPAATTPAPARIGDAGVSVDLPSGWSIAPRPTMSVTDPVQRVVVASTPAAINPKRAACNTEASARVFAPTGAMVLVMEYTSDIGGPFSHYPLRPEQFGPNVSKRVGHRTTAPAFECFDGAGWDFQFSDHGRRFLAWILLGTKANAAVEAEALSVLTSLTVTATR